MQLKETLISLAPALIISSIGGLANYIYKTSKGEHFKLGRMIANIFLAGFIGYIVQAFIPNDSMAYGPLLAITGFCSYPILQIVESKRPNIISNFMSIK